MEDKEIERKNRLDNGTLSLRVGDRLNEDVSDALDIKLTTAEESEFRELVSTDSTTRASSLLSVRSPRNRRARHADDRAKSAVLGM